MAVDGNPQIFLKTFLTSITLLKDILIYPGNTTDLPSNSAIQNLISCHQKTAILKTVLTKYVLLQQAEMFFLIPALLPATY